MSNTVIKCVAAVSILSTLTNAARILGVFPFPSHSHQVFVTSLTMELSRRGHEVTVFTTAPANDPNLKNYTEVDMRFISDDFKKNVDYYKHGNQGLWTFLNAVYEFDKVISDEILSHPAMQRIISPNSTEKFDLIIVSCVYLDALYALSIRLNAPMIGISSLPALSVHHYIFGNPLLLSYSPDALLGYSDNMNLWERIVNTYYRLRQIYDYVYKILPAQEKVLRKHFGDSMPPIHELSKKLSLLFISTHPFFTYPRPNVPAFIHIGGCRSGRPKNNLPRDLKKILDNSESGFIYFSMGSNVKSSQFPVEVRNTLLETFAELPYRVIWKFETDEITNKPDNLVIRKWLPQQEILAHPKLVLFMYQGGLQSTEEAIDNGVPMIGFPVLSDQESNLNKLENLGAAKKLNFAKIEKETLKRTILEIITNSSYKENIVKLRDLLRDLPQHPMEQAVWWTEHVIRHKGAPHLRNRSRDMAWYETELLDVIAIFLVSFVLTVYCSFVIVRCVGKNLMRIVRQMKASRVTTSKKQE